MRTTTKRAFLLLAALISTSCSQVSFETKESKDDLSELALHSETEKIVVTPKVQPPVDILWVVDNSISMREEALQVKNNLHRFIQQVAQKSDLRLTLISQKSDAPAALSLPAGLDGSRFQQVNRVIRSRQNLTVILDELKNSQKNFYRLQAKKILVLVTDDDAAGILASGFMAQYRSLLPNYDLTVHSFIALGGPESSCGDRIGLEYQKLSRMTSGTTFNLCQKDWSSHFDTLYRRLVSQDIPLSKGAKVSSVASVLVNGNKVNSLLYRLENGVLKLSRSVLTIGSSNEIEIKYSYN